MTVKDRILAFLESEGLKKGDFFDAFGIAPSNFRGQSRLSGLNSDTIVKILTEYPDLSAEWLLRGTGNMLICQGATISDDNRETATPTYFVDKIASQAEEIGRLKARIEELERHRGDNAGHALSSDIANVG